ncbi:MAG: aminotransferase class I/II-fold pyridoxal phosphate-dependent enzyme [Bacteroidales bacterium]|jgi:dTDP-4-amino-4,6-dideoxygalactose transaminase|nr:aminotransferase class I/II-fold pyridoxal phosphate-dependent enzyme [Bacteroidales bacterium]
MEKYSQQNIEQTYKKELASFLNADASRIFLYWKGRVALFSLLKAMGVGKDNEVILPAFTCVVVANAILYLGAKPVYVDIDLTTFNPRFEDIVNAVTIQTKVIICQNSFGLSSDIEEITTFAKKHNIYTIEDCTHGFGGSYNQKPNGTYCDTAFFSTQWNKPFSTGTGGFALVNTTKLIQSLQEVNKELLNPSFVQKFSLKLLYFVRDKLVNNHTYWLLIKLYRFLSRHNLFLGSSSGEEISSLKMPCNYFMKLSEVQMKKGIRNLKTLPAILELRKENAHIYTNYLQNHNKKHIPIQLFDNHSFLKYPLLVENREEVFRWAEKYNIELGDWFNSPLHPVHKELELWKLHPELYPNAVYAGMKMINLPTDTKVIHKVLKFLEIINHLVQ